MGKKLAARVQDQRNHPGGIDIDGDELDTPSAATAAAGDGRSRIEPPGSCTVTPGDAVPETVGMQLPTALPSYPELLDGPKTKPAGGRGTGGRQFVLCESGVRTERKGDEERPRCPNCSTDEVAVLCGAKSSPTKPAIGSTTWYYCPVPHCTFSTEVLRQQLAEQFIKRQRGTAKAPPRPHITRP